MAEIKFKSYGIIPVAISANGEHMFLILRAFKNWDFPKGAPDNGEQPIQAAIREFIEETGIPNVNLKWGFDCKETEIYSKNKVAAYFLGSVTQQEIALPINPELGKPEHDEYRWVTKFEATQILPLRLLPILEWADQQINS
jgi:8-oxo-dGTP pyrophosphatase MutT (NUDIX family)